MILMCKPDYYDVDYVINPWMKGNIHHVNTELAKQQWDKLYSIISYYTDVELIQGKPGLPDMVFTANGGLIVGKIFIPSYFKNVERQNEHKEFVNWFEEKEYDIAPVNNKITFEGAGDCLFGKDVYWCGYGFRTSHEGALHISNILQVWYGKQSIPIQLVDERFYHLDTCFCPLNDDSVLLYKNALSKDSYRKLIDVYNYENIIEVSDKEAMNFCCNAVNIDNVIITNYMENKTKQRLKDRGFTVIETPMSEFIKSGGSCKCLTLSI